MPKEPFLYKTNIMKKNILFLAISLVFLTTTTLSAQSPGQDYIIQSNDWLSKVSEKAYGSPHFYARIIKGTNERAINDASYRNILHANHIKLGQKIWIPNPALVESPKTDCQIRVWYNYQVVAIGKINKKWAKDGLDLETRARKAYELRHQARVNARFMMADQVAVDSLAARDMRKYGNPNGPTFEYLLEKNIKKYSISQDSSYQLIIDSSSRTSTAYNENCQ